MKTGYSTLGLWLNLSTGRQLFLILVLSSLYLGRSSDSHAQTNWTGTFNTDWNTSENWSAGVPDTADDVVILYTANRPVISTTAVANSVELQSGAMLIIETSGSLAVNGSKIISGGTAAFYNNGTVQNNGQLIVGNTGPVGYYGLKSSGIFNNNKGAKITIDRATTIGIWNQAGSFTNAGKITIGANAAVGETGIRNDATFNNNGNVCEALINIVSGSIVSNTGTFANSGSIIVNAIRDSNISSNSGIIQNLKSGTFTVTNNTGVITAANNIWKGCTNTNWGTASNWSRDNVPVTNDDVAIPALATNQPTINTMAVAKSVEVQSGATLIITVNSSLTINSFKNIGDTYTGFYNNGMVQNSGHLIVGNTASVGQVGLKNNATFNNNTGAEIKIDRSTDEGLFNLNGTFTNSGKITIGAIASVGGRGLINQAAFNNNIGAEIKIDRSTGSGLWNKNGTFTNSAKIIIGASSAVGMHGLLNNTTFNNDIGAEITIDNSTYAGISNAADRNFTNAAKIAIGTNAAVGQYGLLNYGIFKNNLGAEINIARSTVYGLYNEYGNSIFTNAAKITIGAVASVGGTAIRNDATFNNTGCGALINIVSNSVVRNTNNFINSGTLIENASGDSGISSNTGLVQNLNGGNFFISSGNAAISSSGTIWTGCTGTDWSTTSNWSIFTIPLSTNDIVIPASAVNQPTIAGTAVAKSVEVQSGATLTISAIGSLTINNSKSIAGITTAFYNAGTVQNSGRLLLGNTAPVGQTGLFNYGSGTFNNNLGAEIKIDRSTVVGLLAGSGTFFTNAGKITIGTIESVGNYGLYNYAAFNNNPGAEVNINRSIHSGLYHAGGIFTNRAKIIIGETVSAGAYGLVNVATFNNNFEAEIKIDRSNNTSLINSGDFTNAAKITLNETAPVGNYGLENLGTFYNNSCAVLKLFYPLKNIGSFTNTGLFTLNTAQNHTNNTLTNNGIIEYLQGNSIPNVINNDVIIAPITVCNAVTPALQIGSNNSFTIADKWYKDSTLDTVAGTYTSNTFTVTDLVAGITYPLYFSIIDPANMCTGKVSISITVNPIPPIPTISLSGSTTFCLGDSVTLTSSAVYGNQWYVNGNPITGATGKNYITSTSGDYTVIATLLGCASNPSLASALTFSPIPANIIETEPISSVSVLKVGGEITATNHISGASVVYKGIKTVTLLPDFSATGNSFTAFIGGCENLMTSEAPAAIKR